jgi:hypothetical protein
MPIDYSNWDHLDEYDVDDDNESADGDRRMPQVTRLDGPSSVTFGGGSSGVTTTTTTSSITPSSVTTPTAIRPSPLSGICPSTDKVEKEALSSLTGPTTTITNTANHMDLEQYHDSWTERGGLATVASTPQQELSSLSSLPHNDDHDHDNSTSSSSFRQRRMYWSQDRYSVSIRLELFPYEAAQSVEVVGVTRYIDRFSATGSTKPRLVCTGTTTSTDFIAHNVGVVSTTQQQQQKSSRILLLDGDLPHPVYLAEDDDDIDWSIVRVDSTTTTTTNRRFIFITLYKAVPMQGVFIWWRRPLMHLPELVDVDSSTTSSSTAAATITTNNTQNEAFVKAWDEAHRMFREKKKTPHAI